MASVAQLIELTRAKLDDTKYPYLWSDSELLVALQNAYDEFCRKTNILRSEFSIQLLSNQRSYSINNRITKIYSAWLGNGNTLSIKGEGYLDSFYAFWRGWTGIPMYLIPDYASGMITVVPYYDETYETVGGLVFSATGNTITRSNGGLSKYKVGDSLVITGTVSNNRTVTVQSVTNDTSLVVAESLIDESAINGKLQKVMDTLRIFVARLGEVLTMTTGELEINPQWHYKLLDGVLMECYSKNDTETYDPKAMERYAVLFAKTIEEAKSSMLKLRNYDSKLRPHLGTL